MDRPAAARSDSRAALTVLVMNVADSRGIRLVRSLADLGVAVAIHFTGRRQAVDLLVEEIWDRGGRVCAFGGNSVKGPDREAILRKARSTLGDVQMTVDASGGSGPSADRPSAKCLERRTATITPAPRRPMFSVWEERIGDQWAPQLCLEAESEVFQRRERSLQQIVREGGG